MDKQELKPHREMLRYTVNYEKLGDGNLLLTEGMEPDLTRTICDVKEERFKQALMDLGWTPPGVSTPSLDDVLGEVLNTIAKTMISQGNYEYVDIEDIKQIINEIKEKYGDKL